MTQPFEIVLTTSSWGEPTLENEQARGRAVVRLAPLPEPEDVERETRTADGIIVATNPFRAEHVARLGPRVRVIGRAGVGLDSIDVKAAARRGIAVLYLPDYATSEVATHAVAMILATQRRLLDADRIARGDWRSWRAIGGVRPLEECVAGLVGYGRIGRAVAQRLRPLVGRVQAYDPAADPSETVDSLERLLETSDIVSLHAPLVPETAGLIGREELARMKPDSILVNVSRGGLVDEEALADALESGRLGGAALDVFEREPPPSSLRLLHAPRTLLSPHVAWYSTASERRLRVRTLEGMLEYLSGETPTSATIAR